MSNTITAIREDTEAVATAIDQVGNGFGTLDSRLGGLQASTTAFVNRVAA